MANFPTNPLTGQLFETKNGTYKWNGSAWELLGRILTDRSPPSDPLSSLTIKDSGGRLDVFDTDTVLLVGKNIDPNLLKTAHIVDADTTLLIEENIETGMVEHVSDANTKLLLGETFNPGLSAHTSDLSLIHI